MNVKKTAALLRNKITFKVFSLTAAILLLFSLSTYLIIFTLLPHTYKSYKLHQIDRGIDNFIAKSATISDDEAEKELMSLQQNTNASITIVNESKEVLFPVIHVRVYSLPNPPSTLTGTNVEMNQKSFAISNTIPTAERSMIYKGEKAYLTSYFAPQPIDEASKVLVLLAPYVAVFILIASIGGSYLYSILITRPIRRITASASRMAKLELDTRIPVLSSDEIGGLAVSLNVMAANLQELISDLQMSNEQLQLEMNRERELDVRRRELFAAVSHELKSPLTIIKGQLEGMLYKIGVYEDREIYLDKTLQVAEEMERLIVDILRVARSDDQALLNSEEDVSLQEMLEGMLIKYEELGLQRDVALQSLVSNDLHLRTDQELLEKALSNVVHNAVMYTNPGERVVISEAEKAGSQTIEILNTGAHIDEALIERIFEPFYRLDQSRNRNTGGSGLGLYITKRILQQLGMDIEVRNIDEGVVFSLILKKNASKIHPGSI